jgi:hypothetical protein
LSPGHSSSEERLADQRRPYIRLHRFGEAGWVARKSGRILGVSYCKKCAKLAKPCAAEEGVPCHTGAMKQGYLEALDGHRADIRRTWEILLRAAPATTPLGNPDTLVFLMDESLQQLFSLFRSKSAHQWLSRHPPAARIVGLSCHCRLNPLINYFIAGHAAMAFAAQTVPRSQHHLDDLAATACVDELLLTFRFLAHREIHAFCEVCQYLPGNARAAANGAHSKPICPLPARATARA